MRAVPVVLLLAACAHTGSDIDTEPEDTGPWAFAVDGDADDVQISTHGAGQAEPSAAVLDDGTLIAAWMQTNNDQTLYIDWSRSDDGGTTWTDPEEADHDRYAYQNDPVVVQGGGYVYMTWLAVEYSRSAQWSNIYCKDSVDGGKTWSEPVPLTTGKSFHDREWLAVDPASGRVAMTWDAFINDYEDEQRVIESDGGCDGFGDAAVIGSGQIMNGTPTWDGNGDLWAVRNEVSGGVAKVVLAHRVDDRWTDHDVLEYNAGAMAIDPAAREWAEGLERREEVDGAPQLFHAPNADGNESAQGDFEGINCEIAAALPSGDIAVTALGYEDGSRTVADVWYVRWDTHEGAAYPELLTPDSGVRQTEPWMNVDPWGDVHVIWYEQSENRWLLTGADAFGDEGFTDRTVGDRGFGDGFEDADGAAWVGHFQGLTSNQTGLWSVFGANDDGHSRIMVDRAPITFPGH
jgi:hypothetical protein